MTGVEVLDKLAAFALREAANIIDGDAANLPLAQQVIAIIDEFKKRHPNIGAPPPVDEEAAINAEIDAKVSK